ncbi:MAG: carbon storage regulator [Phycisphaerae bacterium]|nr:carbon storage regulator [Phycisphaerae bacterium]|tara:strand:+ start:1077 stop:1364 length:288 start_codon:yes stop_codon:yes gene_type:complete
MLVLSRHRDEAIMIGDDVEITIVDIRGDKVRIGVNAPSTIPVHRREIYDAIRAENEQASAIEDNPIGIIRPEDRPAAKSPKGSEPRGTRVSNQVQ